MSDCCSSIKNLGCLNMCDTIATGEIADSTGTYKLALVPGGSYIEATITAGNEITFTNSLNEDGITLFQIIKPNGNNLVTSDSEDCFQLDIKTAIDLT